MEQQVRKRLNAADEELASHFTASIGVRAQNYDVFGTVTPDPHGFLISQLGRMQRNDAVERTIESAPPEARSILLLVYAAGAGVLEDGMQQLTGDVDRLLVALEPRRGFGTFVWLACRLPRAVKAYERRAEPGEDILGFLRREAARGKTSASFFAALRNDCEQLRRQALSEYEPLREGRVKSEAEQRRAERRRKREAREQLYCDLMEKQRRKKELRDELSAERRRRERDDEPRGRAA